MEEIVTWSEMLSQFPPMPGRLLALDPGETTGFAIFEDGILEQYGQIETFTVVDSVKVLQDRIIEATHVVVENYQVYAWKLKEHKFSTLHTPRLIGCIETLCILAGVGPPTKQTAQNAKKFTTDEKLKHWGMYVKGKPHARDAIRHGVFYTVFSGTKLVERTI